MYRFIVVLVVTATLTSCTPASFGHKTIRSSTMDDLATCATSVEGSLSNTALWSWTGRTPALVLHFGNDPIIGEIVEIGETSVIFDGEKQSRFLDPKPKEYPLEKVKFLVGADGELLFGEVPIMPWAVRVYLETDKPDQKKAKIEIEPETQFSACIEPGDYAVKKIEFTAGRREKSRSIFIKPMRLVVEEGVANYIGAILLTEVPDKVADYVVVGERKLPTAQIGMLQFHGKEFFYFDITVDQDPDYQPVSKGELKVSLPVIDRDPSASQRR